MKKLLVVLCMLTCIFATTACGSDKADVVEPEFLAILDDAAVEEEGGNEAILKDYALSYYELMVECVEEDLVDTYAFQYGEEMEWLKAAATSYNSALEDMGSVKDFAFDTQEELDAFLDSIEVNISEKEVIINFPLDGT